jgi:hypothetical protein
MENEKKDESRTDITEKPDVSVPKGRPVSEDTESLGHDATTGSSPPTPNQPGSPRSTGNSTPGGATRATPEPTTKVPTTPGAVTPVPTPGKVTPLA